MAAAGCIPAAMDAAAVDVVDRAAGGTGVGAAMVVAACRLVASVAAGG